jgi:hypothetical protein
VIPARTEVLALKYLQPRPTSSIASLVMAIGAATGTITRLSIWNPSSSAHGEVRQAYLDWMPHARKVVYWTPGPLVLATYVELSLRPYRQCASLRTTFEMISYYFLLLFSSSRLLTCPPYVLHLKQFPSSSTFHISPSLIRLVGKGLARWTLTFAYWLERPFS